MSAIGHGGYEEIQKGIPPNMDILLVEQEVAASDTISASSLSSALFFLALLYTANTVCALQKVMQFQRNYSGFSLTKFFLCSSVVMPRFVTPPAAVLCRADRQ